ncbi:DUF3343 domain-containing protein [Thermohalobacter berrensis]|uniref:Putative Se/S carrier protein-like domain-containing protein n=1 Tax=Thermohalobacter berrensis TaxID=99594 RepID=A0A419T4C4_9FIRM|nr:DUF3343 domain-containing protein [Thermohalobacter berrensis]RKD32302.1 hypothetical protein BET03_03045 [Thermohalobacter berrensis]
MQNNTYILFPSHTDGLSLEKLLKEKKIKYTIVPTPRQLSKCCGISIKINPNDKEKVEELLIKNPNIKIEGIYTLEKKTKKFFV